MPITDMLTKCTYVFSASSSHRASFAARCLPGSLRARGLLASLGLSVYSCAGCYLSAHQETNGFLL